MTRAIVLALALALGGCNVAPDLSALAQDPNAICLTVTSVWFSTTVNRNHGCEPAAAK